MMAAGPMNRERMLGALLAGISELAPGQDRPIAGLRLDSTQVRPGDLFFACAGTRQHGRDFIPQAIAAGAAAVLLECRLGEPVPPAVHAARIPVIQVVELRQKIGAIAERFYGQPSSALTVIGVTGTNGKTSCSQFIAQALSAEAPCGVIGTLGYGLYGQLRQGAHTTPDAIELHRLLAEVRDAGAKAVVMEVSSHGLEQGRVNGVAFDIAVFTNLSRDHLDYHGDMQKYGEAKRRLFDMPGLRHAVINADDAFGRALLGLYNRRLDVLAYSVQLRTGTGVPLVSGAELELSAEGVVMRVQSPQGTQQIAAPLLGRFNAANLLAAYAVLLQLQVPPAEAAARLAQVRPVPGRMERFGGGAQPLVVVDYAHTPDALEQVLHALREHCQGRLWCVFGCGGERDRGKRPLMGAAAERLAERVIITDDNPRSESGAAIVEEILSGIEPRSGIEVIRDRAQAIAAAIEQAEAGDVVLIAGKGHEDYQLVGKERLNFSDSEQVRRCLQQRGRA